MAVTDYPTKLKRHKKGICSSWLANSTTEEIVPVWFAKGTMKLPKPLPGMGQAPPIIMIGPGTGVAAFRSFIQFFAFTYPSQT